MTNNNNEHNEIKPDKNPELEEIKDNVLKEEDYELPEEEILEMDDEELNDDEATGSWILGFLIAIASFVNFFVLLFNREGTIKIGNPAGLVLSIVILISIILLGFFWFSRRKKKKKKKKIPRVLVQSLSNSRNKKCDSSKDEFRIVYTDTAIDSWKFQRAYTKKPDISTKYVPSSRFCRYGFAVMSHTHEEESEKQKCVNNKWIPIGKPSKYTYIHCKEIQVYGGPPPSAPYQAWTTSMIKQSADSGYHAQLPKCP